MKIPPNALRFINLVQYDCIQHGVEVVFHPTDRIKMAKDFYVAGYWSEDDLQLNVAISSDEWLTILAHEYGHFCQWKENKFTSEKTHNAYISYDDWLVGEIELSDKQLNAACAEIQKCELDCEKRAAKLIKKYKLANDVEQYIQKSNSYVLGYEASKKVRKWFKIAPSRIEKLYKSMPKKFTKSLKPTKRQLKIMIESCF